MVGDLDGDTDADVLVQTNDGSTWFSQVYLNDGSGGLSPSGPVFNALGQFDGTLEDLDGDGDLDPAVLDLSLNEPALLRNDGAGSLSLELLEVPAGTWSAPFVLDLDADGDLDLLATMSTMSGDWHGLLAGDSGPADTDGDGVEDPDDLCPDTAAGEFVDAVGCSDAQVDSDGDGVCDPGAASGGPSACTGSDSCADDYNPGQEDLDEDGIGDLCDPDADGDEDPATSDCDDLDPSRYHGAEEICNDSIDNDCDGMVDLDDNDGDCDGDDVPNVDDNCPDDYNPGQVDTDEDGLGDTCDPDDDGDGIDDVDDNCDEVANPGQEDFDGDGAGDACDTDSDGDGLNDFTEDMCDFTARNDPEAGVPSRSLGRNRWADMDGDGVFDTNGNNPTGRMYSIYATAGCNCAQIIELCGYGQGHVKFGCSNSVMDTWTGLYDRQGQAPFQCE